MVLIAGVEEAGRGPVIGPMVMAAVVIEDKDEPKLKAAGVKDSKKLSPSQRSRIFEDIKKIAKSIKIIIIDPDVIDISVESENHNLNWLEADKTIEMLNSLKPKTVFIDCPSNNILAYSNYIRTKLSTKMEIRAEHKADERYLVVGAASIIAKVTRDREIEKLKEKLGVDFGSGYPSDPTTKRFIEENWQKYPKIFRHSWETYKEASKFKIQSRLGEF
ncbi:MAG: ribonuclease HII [Candidatus Woesearchaeota archaeon]|nr:ribonuclease HII [Candidatus Woesearchaeota archaeon]